MSEIKKKKVFKIYNRPVLCANGKYKVLKLTRRLAQIMWCTECLGFETDPKDCTCVFCPHYPFRARTLCTKKGDLSKDEAKAYISIHG